MASKDAAAIDIIIRAHHRHEPNELLDLLADDAEYVRDDMNSPGNPSAMSGRDEIAGMIEEVFSRDMTHEVGEVVVGDGGRITRIVEHVSWDE
jgi:hypothetical protein